MKTVEDLREHLFATLQGLRDGTVTVEKAAAMASVGQVIVNSAKVEADMMKHGAIKQGTGFITALPEPPPKPGQARLVSPMGNR